MVWWAAKEGAEETLGPWPPALWNYKMSFQVRHKEFGIFQGELWGMGFWHPMSEQPEQGLYNFCSIECATKFIEYYCKCGKGDYQKNDFTIEPFDEKLDFEMQLAELEEV